MEESVDQVGSLYPYSQTNENLIQPLSSMSSKCQSSSHEDPVNFDVSGPFTIDKVFDSRNELIGWCRDTGRAVGTVVVIKKSDNSGRTPRISFCCERSGMFREHKKKSDVKKPSVRHSGIKQCECPFELKGIKLLEDDKWKVMVVSGIHSHPLIRNFEGHSFVGRLNTEGETVLKEMMHCGVKPREVLNIIKQKDNRNASTIRTIYNACKKIRVSEMDGRTQLQQLMKNLHEYGCVEFSRRDEATNVLRELYWVHPDSIQLARCFPLVLLMDCTYKINKFRMPLLHILGVTCTGLTFSVAFVFMEAEKEDNYRWALECLKGTLDQNALPLVIVTDMELTLMNAIEKVFPSSIHFLCRFHISRNVMTNCKCYFKTNAEWEMFLSGWHELVNSNSEIEYFDRLSSFEIQFSQYSKALAYVKDNWLSKYKDRFIAAWTEKTIHFGNTTTNRVESSHAKLKWHLWSSQCNFTTNWGVIHNLILGQITEVRASFEKSLTHVKHERRRMSLLKDLFGSISRTALDLINTEMDRCDDVGVDIYSCGCVIRRTHGLPCAHEIVQFQHDGLAIPLSAIHPFWRHFSDVPICTPSSDLTSSIEFQMLCKCFEESNEDEQASLLKKINEIANPSTSLLVEPVLKTDTKSGQK